jgi:hypothetical protein
MKPFRAALLSVPLALALAPAALAASASFTKVTVPATGTVGPLDYNGASYPMTVSGTSDGDSGIVTLYCFYLNEEGDREYFAVTSSLPVQPDGTFTTSTANGDRIGYHPCRLAALPAATDPADTSLQRYDGPRLSAVTRSTTVQSGGPNDGKNLDFYDAVTGERGYVDFVSAGKCGLDDSRVFSAPNGLLQQESQYVWYCEAYWPRNIQRVPGTYRSGVQVDAFLVDGAWNGVTRTTTYDAASRRTTIVETDALVKCPSDVSDAPVGAGNCPTLSPLGVGFKRTTVVDHEALVVTETDEWTSTTGAHTLDFLEDYDMRGNSSRNGWRFPGESAFVNRLAVEEVPISNPGKPTSIRITMDTTRADGDPRNPRGSITFSNLPDKAVFTSTTGNFASLHSTLQIPANGTASVTRIFAQEMSLTALAPLTTEAEDRLAKPAVAFSAPAEGATVATDTVTVTGNASDNVGVSSVKVNGKTVDLSSGSFSTLVALTPGANTVTAVATDATGNTATATRAVTYTEPVVIPVVTPPSVDGTAVACPAAGPACAVAAKWTTVQAFAAAAKKRKVVMARRTLTVQPGRIAHVKPKLTKAGRKLLAKHRSVRVRRRIGAVATGSAPVVKTATTRLRAPKKKG